MNQRTANTLNLSKVTFSYPGQSIFNNLSVDIPTGVSLIRCDESRGKSTLIQLLAGMVLPQKGSISLDGLNSRTDHDQYQGQVYYFDVRSEMFDQISSLQYFAEVEKNYPDFDRAMIPALIAGLGLTPHQDKPLYMLSAGSKRKVWIAAALASGAKITLIDDLTAALDRGSIEFIIEQLITLALDTKRHIVISHYDTLDRVPFASILDI
jgi:ABC-type multidrug transport system ATPase subunit